MNHSPAVLSPPARANMQTENVPEPCRKRGFDDEPDGRQRQKMRVDNGRGPRRVKFSSEEPRVFYFETYREGEGFEKDVNDNEATDENGGTSSRLTEELTVLSSKHGRARRHLRDISKHDLRTAIKHGVKMPAQTVRGERRWKFVFGNIVYVTDATCTKEITSYKQAVTIEPATITPKMREEHNESVRILRDEPHLCTTHSFIIVDQSGSMRESDVNGFRSRSQAAYGTLALDYIAEQLYSRGDELFVDSITIIEMNDCGTVVVTREPLDWILFNKILCRQIRARPRSHGNYVNSLQLASNIISSELSCLHELDDEDMPAYMLVMLSDGRPSDKLDSDAARRQSIIASLARRLGQKLTVYGMGIGAVGSDFRELKLMVEYAKLYGAEGGFNHAGLSSASLSNGFSSIATSMTSTRTELLATKDGHREKKEKVYTMRKKNNDTKEWPSRRCTHNVARYRYDITKEYPWKRINFVSESASGFEVEKDPFGKGAERLAFRFYEIYDDGGKWKRAGEMMVAKESKYIEDEGKKESFHYDFCHVQHAAYDLAGAFNKAVKKAPLLRPREDGCSKPPLISFLKCHVYEYTGMDGILSGLLVENYLKGKFTKYNGNNGYVVKQRSGPTIDLVIGEVFLTDFVQAFSHWVYVASEHKNIVCDLQGVLNEEGRYPRFQLTDPAICTKKKHHRYGKTDLGMKGIRNFCRTHKCNGVCKGLGLPIIRDGDKSK